MLISATLEILWVALWSMAVRLPCRTVMRPVRVDPKVQWVKFNHRLCGHAKLHKVPQEVKFTCPALMLLYKQVITQAELRS